MGSTKAVHIKSLAWVSKSFIGPRNITFSTLELKKAYSYWTKSKVDYSKTLFKDTPLEISHSHALAIMAFVLLGIIIIAFAVMIFCCFLKFKYGGFSNWISQNQRQPANHNSDTCRSKFVLSDKDDVVLRDHSQRQMDIASDRQLQQNGFRLSEIDMYRIHNRIQALQNERFQQLSLP